MKAEIATNLTNAEYHARPEISSSGIKTFEESPLAYWNEYLNPDIEAEKEADHLRLGTLFHTYLLEPHAWEDQTYSLDGSGFDNWMSKASKEYKAEAEAAGKTLIKPDDMWKLKAMRRAVLAHPEAAALLDIPGAVEYSVFFTDPASGEKCRVRPDYWMQDAGVLLDLKTIHDAHPDTVAKHIANYRYDLSAAFYMDGCNQTDHPPVEQFVWLFVQKPKRKGEVPPVVLFECPTGPNAHVDMIEKGREDYKYLLTQIAEMREKYGTDQPWPGPAPGLNFADYPRWFYHQRGIV